jgi:hypothetical protein|tara:strand:- start:391 stop:918 length:528 start_codon:yes stop_codon:yes gene_type:complete
VKDGTYSLSGQYNMGVPEIEASKYQFELTSPLEVEEEDPKAKKAPPAKAPAAEAEEEGNEVKIQIDNALEDETKKIVGFKLTVVHQAAAYEDPNPPEDDPAANKKGKAANAEPEVRMITPDPVVMANEQGREFEIEIGRIEDVKIDTTQTISQPPQSSAGGLEGAASKVSGEPTS